MFPPTLLCGAMVLNVSLRKCILGLQGKGEEAPPTLDHSKQQDVSAHVRTDVCVCMYVTFTDLAGRQSGSVGDV